MSAATTTNFSIGSVLKLLWRHKFKLALLPPVIIGCGILAIIFLPRTYQSNAKLFLQVGKETVGIDPTATTGDTIALSQSGREVEVNTAMDVLKSRSLAALVVDELGPEFILKGPPAEGGGGEKKPPALIGMIKSTLGAAVETLRSIDPVTDRERAIIQLEKSLVIDAERESMVIALSYETDSAKGAQAILSTLIDQYDDEYLRIHRNAASGEFFEGQLAILKKQLDDSVQQLNTARNDLGLASVQARRESLENQLQAIELSSYDSEQEHATSLARVEELRQQLAELPERLVAMRKSVPNAGADLMREQLYALEVKQMDLKARYNDTHPLVVAVSAQLDEAKNVLDKQSDNREETTDDINPLHRDLSLELKQQETAAAGFAARLKMRQEQKQAVLEDLKALNVGEIKIDQLERAEKLARLKYFQYADNLEQSRIDSELERSRISSISVVQPATLQDKPVSPSKLLLLAGSMLLALTAPATLILLSERLRQPAPVVENPQPREPEAKNGDKVTTEFYRVPRTAVRPHQEIAP